jgi:RimJ/RimL family protein N-acetyltransferase
MNEHQTHQIDVIVPGTKVFLGPLRSEFVSIYREWSNNVRVAAMMGTMNQGPFPITQQGAEEWFKETVSDPSIAAFGVYEQGSNNPVGYTVLEGIRDRNRGAEFGIALGETSVWGRGYATEAAMLTLDYGFTLLGMHLIYLYCAAINERAIEIYRRIGFREAGRIREAGIIGGKRHDAVFMDILAREFESTVLARMLGIDTEAG